MTDASNPAIPADWKLQSFPDTFSAHAGPFYFRDHKEKEPGVGFYAEPHHANANGVVHGGVLLTLADMSLWDICRRVAGPLRAVTVTVNAEFIGPGQVGKFIMATGEPTKIGKSLLFARGMILCDGEPLMNFSGTLKRFNPKPVS
jgi:uncharacterized protein (TIGR00369 family)